MPDRSFVEPWQRVRHLLTAGDGPALEAYLDALPTAEVARAVWRLEPEDQQALLSLLRPQEAADLLEELPEAQGADLLGELPAEQAAAIVDRLDSDARADLLAELPEESVAAILTRMDPAEADDARRLLRYAPETAGGLMATEFLAFPEETPVEDVLYDLRRNAARYADFPVQYLFVTSAEGRLSGVAPLRDLVMAPPRARLADVALRTPQTVPVDLPLEALEDFFQRHPFYGAPVLDGEGRMVGVVERAEVERAAGDRADRSLMRLSGIMSGEELRSMPLGGRAMHRLVWLVVNVPLNLLAAGVILKFQTTLEAVITLAFFLPIISDMSGNAGSQALAVSLRELTLGLTKPRDVLFVVVKELHMGILCGLALAVLLGATAALWTIATTGFNPWLGIVVGAAMGANILLADVIGGLMPLVVRRLRLDPALVAAPVLTTLTDMLGFLILLGLATMLLHRLAA